MFELGLIDSGYPLEKQKEGTSFERERKKERKGGGGGGGERKEGKKERNVKVY